MLGGNAGCEEKRGGAAPTARLQSGKGWLLRGGRAASVGEITDVVSKREKKTAILDKL